MIAMATLINNLVVHVVQAHCPEMRINTGVCSDNSASSLNTALYVYLLHSFCQISQCARGAKCFKPNVPVV